MRYDKKKAFFEVNNYAESIYIIWLPILTFYFATNRFSNVYFVYKFRGIRKWFIILYYSTRTDERHKGREWKIVCTLTAETLTCVFSRQKRVDPLTRMILPNPKKKNKITLHSMGHSRMIYISIPSRWT